MNDVSVIHLVNTQTTHKVTINRKQKTNCVRMYLGVEYVSEVCTVDGTGFVPDILEGDDCQLNYQTTLTKPYQEKPGEHSWMLWRRILKMLTPTPKTTTNKLQRKKRKMD